MELKIEYTIKAKKYGKSNHQCYPKFDRFEDAVKFANHIKERAEINGTRIEITIVSRYINDLKSFYVLWRKK